MPLVKASLMVRIGQFVIDMILAKKRDQLEEEGRERWSLLCFIVALLLMLVVTELGSVFQVALEFIDPRLVRQGPFDTWTLKVQTEGPSSHSR